MEFFRNTNIDFLGKKWYFLAFSLVFSVAGILSMLFWHGIPYGVDFRGGTLVYVKFSHTPNDNALRAAMDRAGLHNAKIQRYDVPSNNEVLIDLDVQETSEQALDNGKTRIINTLETNAPPGKVDLNNASSLAIKNYLMDKDPMHLGSDADQKYTQQSQAIVDARDKGQGGVLTSFDQLRVRSTQPWWLPCQTAFSCLISAYAMLRSWGRRWVRSCGGKPCSPRRIRWRAC